MSRASSTVSDLLAQAGQTPQSVQGRLERRLVVLRAWLKDGIPPGKAPPESLTAARKWEDAELGIQRISSPNEFTTTHPQHGKLVSEVARLLTELTKRYTRPAQKTRSQPSTASERFDRQAFERQLAIVCSQWNSERAQRLDEKKRADAAEARSLKLLEENAQMEKLIADLRRELATRTGLRAVD